MKLTVIGCSGSYPGPQAPASCYLVEADHEGRTWRLLLDMGSGSLGELHNHVDPLTVDAVLLSHLHADHCLDLCGYYVMRKYHPKGPQPRIPVWGPAESDRRMAKAYDLDENPGMNEEFDFQELRTEPMGFGPFTITAYRVAHPVTAYALRVEAGGRVLTYSGDTGACEALVDAARDADLFLAEAAFRERDQNPVAIHLTGREAAEAALKAGASRLVLTHIPAWHDKQDALTEAVEIWDGPLDLAERGAVYEV